MGYPVKQSTTAQPLVFKLYQTGTLTPATGLTVSVELSKNGGSFAACAGGVSEIGGGMYKVAGNATDSNTLGPLILKATATGADTETDVFMVVAYDPQTAYSTLDAAGTRSAVGLASANLDTQIATLSTLTLADVRSAIGLASANLDTQLSNISTKTTNLPSDPADASDIAASFATVNVSLAALAGYVDTEVAAIKAKTDNLPASPAATSDIPSAAAVADAVWDEATSGHATAGTTGAALTTTVALSDEDITAIASEVLAGLSTANITVSAPVIEDDGRFTLRRGDGYYDADGRAISFTSTVWPDLTGATVTLKIKKFNGIVTITGTASGAGTQIVKFDITEAQTLELEVGPHRYDIEAILANDHEVTLNPDDTNVITVIPQVE